MDKVNKPVNKIRSYNVEMKFNNSNFTNVKFNKLFFNFKIF